jgi:hypothetical protein
MGIDASDEEIMELIASIDVDGNGLVEWSEFVQYIAQQLTDPQAKHASAELGMALQTLTAHCLAPRVEQPADDPDALVVDVDLIVHLMQTGGMTPLSAEEAEELRAHLDADGTGLLRHADLCAAPCWQPPPIEPEVRREVTRKFADRAPSTPAPAMGESRALPAPTAPRGLTPAEAVELEARQLVAETPLRPAAMTPAEAVEASGASWLSGFFSTPAAARPVPQTAPRQAHFAQPAVPMSAPGAAARPAVARPPSLGAPGRGASAGRSEVMAQAALELAEAKLELMEQVAQAKIQVAQARLAAAQAHAQPAGDAPWPETMFGALTPWRQQPQSRARAPDSAAADRELYA